MTGPRAKAADPFGLEPSRGRKLVPISLSGLAIGFVVGLLTDFGDDAKADYFTTTAQVSGTVFVLLLALIALLQAHLDVRRSAAYLTQLFLALLAQVGVVLAVCLYAIAANTSSTFLVMSSAITLALQLALAAVFAFVTAFPMLVARGDEVFADALHVPREGGRSVRCAERRRARRRLIKIAGAALNDARVVAAADEKVLRQLHDDLIRLAVRL